MAIETRRSVQCGKSKISHQNQKLLKQRSTWTGENEKSSALRLSILLLYLRRRCAHRAVNTSPLLYLINCTQCLKIEFQKWGISPSLSWMLIILAKGVWNCRPMAQLPSSATPAIHPNGSLNQTTLINYAKINNTTKCISRAAAGTTRVSRYGTFSLSLRRKKKQQQQNASAIRYKHTSTDKLIIIYE